MNLFRWRRLPSLLIATVLVGSCGRTEAPIAAPLQASESRSTLGVICTFAPSQSEVVRSVTSAAGSAALAATAVAKALGLKAVLHSSGVYIFTGSTGYVAGTFGGAGAVPAIVVLAVAVGGTAVTLELLCAPWNHPDWVAKVGAAAQELSDRTTRYIGETKQSLPAKVAPVVAEVRKEFSRGRADAFEYANRASIALGSQRQFNER